LNFGIALPQQAQQWPAVHCPATLHRFRVNEGIMECFRVFPSIPYSLALSSFLLNNHKHPVLAFMIYDKI
jgi:hypothetical protein